MTMPADIRSLAQEAVDLAMVCECGHHRDAHEGHTCMVGQDPPRHCSACGCPRFESQSEAASHAGTHYATIAKALLEALDDRDAARRNYQFMVDRVADEKLDGYRELGSRAASAENDRDKILAALPHALRSCGCELKPAKFVPRQSMLSGGTMRMRWPEEHEAAIEWLKGRIK